MGAHQAILEIKIAAQAKMKFRFILDLPEILRGSSTWSVTNFLIKRKACTEERSEGGRLFRFQN